MGPWFESKTGHHFGRLAQLVERYPYKVDVSGSSPLATTIRFNVAAVVQLVRIPACHAGGREFESRPPATIHFLLLIDLFVVIPPPLCYNYEITIGA